MKQQTLKYLYDNLKDGDHLLFFHSKWYYLFSKVIASATGEKIDHLAIVYKVNRTCNLVTFDLYEQRATKGGCKHTYSIFIDEYGVYHLNGFSADKLYYSELSTRLTKKQISIGYKDAESQIGKEYGFIYLPLMINFIAKFVPNKWLKSPLQSERVCSQFGNINDYKMGLISEYNFNKDKWRSPADMVDLAIKTGYRNVYEITDYMPV